MNRALPLALALSLPACLVSPADWAGFACDETHACFDGRECIEGQCRFPGPQADGGALPDAGSSHPEPDAGASDAGPTGAGSSDAGLADAGGADAGSCVGWAQTRDGFAAQRVGPGATLVIAPSLGHRLTATLPSAADSSDFAAGSVSAASLPRGSEGQLRGRLFVPASARLDGLAPFLRVATARGNLLELGFDNGWELAAFTTAGVLQASAVNQPRSALRAEPGQQYTVRVAWRAGAFRRVWVGSTLVFDDRLTPASGLDTTVTSVELGLIRYDGSGQDPLTMTLSDWLLCDRAEEALP